MKLTDKQRKRIRDMLDLIYRNKKTLIALSCIVVFITTYMLILPALTLDKDEAAEQGGISLETAETGEVTPEMAAGIEPEDSEEAGETASVDAPEEDGEAAGKADGSDAPQDQSQPVQTDEKLIFEGENYTVAVADGASQLPAGTSIDVHEITQDDKEYKDQYNDLYAEALKALQKEEGKDKVANLGFAKFYDITLLDGEDEVQPEGSVDVTIEFDKTLQKELSAKKADNVRIIHFIEDKETGKLEAEILDSRKVEVNTNSKDKLTDTTFAAEGFSVYSIVYTVDFHYEINGERIDFGIQGGGYLNLADLVGDLASEIESVEFSSPELAWTGQAGSDTTVGAIKEANGLDVQYSSELTEEDIDAINSAEVAGGDWILISIMPFTTEETLTVTMKNGDQFIVRVTDYQNATSMSEFDGTTQFVIWAQSGNSYYALKGDGTTVQLNNLGEIDSLGQDFLWTVTYGWEQERDVDYRYYIRPVSNPQSSLTMSWTGQDLVQQGGSGTRFYPNPSQNDVWYLEGWNWSRLYLNPTTHVFEVSMGQTTGNYSWVHFSKQEILPQFEFTVQAESTDTASGFVSGFDKDGINQQAQESFTGITNQNKTNRNRIEASPLSARYLFDYWDLDGTTLYWDPATQTISTEPGSGRITDFTEIPAGKLTIPYNRSTLTAHFKRNPDYEVTDDEKEGRLINKEELNQWLGDLMSTDFPLNEDGCNKTAELYDYENRIYRVDLTAKSNMSALAGTVDLGFMLDVSASMKFPSKLNMVSRWNNTQTTTDENQQLQLLLNNINDSNWNKENWLNRNTEYYIIADKTSTATVDKIKFDWGSYSWRFKDASKNDDAYATIDHNTHFHRSDATGLTYPIYVDGDNGLQRRYYLERSMTATLTELQSILNKLNVAADPSQASDALIAYNKFHKDVIDSHYAFVPASQMSFGTYAYDGGTSTDRALADAQGFAWSSSAAKYAILITDGAPQRSGDDVPNEDVARQAAILKSQGVTLITVGLSMGDVKRGSILLYDIASLDKNGDPYFYSAESGDELEYVLLEIIRQIISDAITVGDITDTINEAFYPVDKATGAPLAVGNVIDLNGVKIANNVNQLTPQQRQAGYGVIGRAQDGNFNVTWTGQDIPWEGWHGTIYEKAKEDFLGGNAVRTNDPLNPATIVPTGYKADEDDQTIAFKQDIVTGKTQTFETPRVNVNELNLTENSTEWTVYLGTEVDPKEQLQQLFDNMHAEQVVTNAIDTDGDGIPDTMSGNSLYYPLQESDSDRRESEATGTRLSFSLHDVLKKSHGGVDVTIDQLIAAGDDGITWPYDLYGQDNPGKITIKLTKTGTTANYDTHVTTETGQEVERYSISVLFSPEYSHIPVGQGGDGSLPYHTGYFGLGSYGNAAGTEEGLNEHINNVFVKRLQLLKVDQSHNSISKEAVFGLYRKATAAEMSDGSVEKVTLDGLSGSYVLEQELRTSGGTVTTEQLPLLPDNESYYLKEISAPAGYDLLKETLKISIDMTGHDTWKKNSDGTTSQTKPDPYELSDRLQEATILVTALDGTSSNYAIRVIPDGQHGIVYDHTNDTTNASVAYQIVNDAGVELPHTGGMGTTLFYVIGTMLVLASCIYFVTRRRVTR